MALWRPSDDTTNTKLGWWDANPIDAAGSNATSTITQAAGTASAWADSSSAGKNASNATASTQPSVVTSGLNSKTVLRFAGSHRLDFTAFTLPTTYTLFAVVKETSTNQIATILGGDYNTGGGTFATSASAFAVTGPALWDGAGGNLRAGNLTWSAAHVLCFQPAHNYVDATEQSYANTGTPGAFKVSSIGVRPDNTGATGFTGDIAELILISGIPSAGDRDLYEGYLAWKWGLQGSLPSGHTYKSAAPTVSGGSSATGSGSYTEAGDTGSGSGTSGSTGSGSYTEGADTGSGAGTRGATGSGSYTEAADAGSGSGASGSTGSGGATEAGDTGSGSGSTFTGFSGAGGSTEAGDTGSGSGASGSAGSGAYTEAGDTGSGSGSALSPATGSGSYTEGPDTGTGTGQAAIPATGSGSYTETPDIGAGSGRVPVPRAILRGPSVGIDRRTGRVLIGFPHVRQSMGVIFTTRIGERAMRRTFGSNVPGMLGKNLTKRTVLRFAAAVIVALDFWEPRFAIKQIGFEGNSAEKMRQGGLRISLVGEYRPRAHLGDFTPEGAERTIDL